MSMNNNDEKILYDIDSLSQQARVGAMLNQAVIHIQSGHLEKAEGLLQGVLAVHPDQPDANHLMGIIAGQRGNPDLASAFIARAIMNNPGQVRYHSTHALVLLQSGKLEEAVAACERVIKLNPELSDGYNNLGYALNELGRTREAVAVCERAIELNPRSPDAYINRGNALRILGNLEGALADCDYALRLDPDNPEAHNNRGNALRELGQLEEALAAYKRAVHLKPGYAQAHFNCGLALWELGSLEKAEAAYELAIVLNPDYSEAYSNLGLVLRDMGRLEQALEREKHAIELNPLSAEAHNNHGTVLHDLGCLDEAVAACRKAISIKPDYASAHYNLALFLLLTGDFREGWSEHEWRWDAMKVTSPDIEYNRPQWNGGPLHGKTILLHAEQGFGDTIQFIRYLPFVTQAGGRTVVSCQKELMGILRNMPGIDLLVRKGDTLPEFDEHAPLMSLPYIFGTTIESIPDEVPYLSPIPDSTAGSHVVIDKDKRNIGFVWAGNPSHKNDRNRSVDLATFSELVDIPDIKWFSLQVGERATDINSTEGFGEVTDTSPWIKNFTDTASIIEELDLVISVDTAVVHLAGAMKKPVWVLLPFVSDWRWLLSRTDSPWYPGMRLFRQPMPGDWRSVFSQVRQELLA